MWADLNLGVYKFTTVFIEAQIFTHIHMHILYFKRQICNKEMTFAVNTWRFWLEVKSGGWGQLVSKSKVVQFCHMDLDWPSIMAQQITLYNFDV